MHGFAPQIDLTASHADQLKALLGRGPRSRRKTGRALPFRRRHSQRHLCPRHPPGPGALRVAAKISLPLHRFRRRLHRRLAHGLDSKRRPRPRRSRSANSRNRAVTPAPIPSRSKSGICAATATTSARASASSPPTPGRLPARICAISPELVRPHSTARRRPHRAVDLHRDPDDESRAVHLPLPDGSAACLPGHRRRLHGHQSSRAAEIVAPASRAFSSFVRSRFCSRRSC